MTLQLRVVSAGLLLLAFSPRLSAYSAVVGVNELVSESQLVVLAEVASVVDAGVAPRQYRLATARVLETWKGTIHDRSIQFIASPGWFMCDTSDARAGEKVILFLKKESGESHPRIAHFGRGRMRVGLVGGSEVALIYEVTFPTAIAVHKERTYPFRESVGLEAIKSFVKNHPSQFSPSS
jgi:hypothetical protein